MAQLEIHTTRQGLNDALPKTGSTIGVMFFSNHPRGLHVGHQQVINTLTAENDISVLIMHTEPEQMPRTMTPFRQQICKDSGFPLPALGATTNLFPDNNEVRQEAIQAGIDHLLLCPIYKDDFNDKIAMVLATPLYLQWITNHDLDLYFNILHMFYYSLNFHKVFNGVYGLNYYTSTKDIFHRRLNTAVSDLMESNGEDVSRQPRNRVCIPVARDNDGLLYEAYNEPQLKDARIMLKATMDGYTGTSASDLHDLIDLNVRPLLSADFDLIPDLKIYDLENIILISNGIIPTDLKCQIRTRIFSKTQLGEHFDEFKLYNLDETKRINTITLEEIP